MGRTNGIGQMEREWKKERALNPAAQRTNKGVCLVAYSPS